MSPRVIVAGCGAAGMMAAITAARKGAQVTVLEGMEKPGKKLLLTGNGRCNLTNQDPALTEKYQRVFPVQSKKHPVSPASVLRQFTPADALDFFHSLGLLTADKNGYVYPYTGQSSSVLELLLAEMKRLRIKLKLSEKIIHIKKEDQWLVQTKTWTYRCDRLILCCGSRAAQDTGSDGSGYLLAKQAGHTILPVFPALTALNGDKKKFLTACAGVRCPAQVTLYAGAKPGLREASPKTEWDFLAGDRGELQITEKGISGIVVFQVSRYASIALAGGRPVRASLDLMPDLSPEVLRQLLEQAKNRFQNTECSVVSALCGLIPQKLLTGILEEQKIRPGTSMAGLTAKELHHLTRSIKEFLLPITGTRPFSQCQVCAGGVPLEEVNPETLESLKTPGLYFAGEILDVDGPCGGYNLQWAWSSGYAAGQGAAGS